MHCGINKKRYLHYKEIPFLAVWTGLEPPTPCVTGMYSNQLNYHTFCTWYRTQKPLETEGLFYLAVWTGLEPATPCVTGMYSNQLNYQTKILIVCQRNFTFAKY